MDSDASAQQSPPADPTAASGRRRSLSRSLQGFMLLLGAAWLAVGAWHGFLKPLPAGMHVASAAFPTDAGSVRLLSDITTADAFGRPIVRQEIFDETLRVIGAAREFVVLDQFLFNAHGGASGAAGAPPLRPLSRQLVDALLDVHRNRRAMRILVITDPINDVYGGDPSPELRALQDAGIRVVRTDLDSLRDSNPGYSAIWRLAINWWAGDGSGPGWLPNPFDAGPERVTFRSWARLLNLKANHRKVVIADDGAGRLVGIVGSANPHDASSAHSNLALEVRGEALRPLLESELAVARASGWDDPRWSLPPPPAAAPAPAAPVVAAEPLGVSVLTEGAIRAALLQRIAATQRGDYICAALFLIADRGIVEGLLGAARRGVDVRLLLDPNKDAFGRQKSGIPNRPVASELVSRSDGAIHVRWYRTHGEQFHPKMVMVGNAQRVWLTVGSANLTRRNLADFNLEANLAVDMPATAQLALDARNGFDTLWTNVAPAGVEYSADFGTFADPAQSSYWTYRLMEATGLSTF